MKKVRITVMRKACYEDLMAKYENPMEDACAMEEGQVFIANGWQRPEGLCESAWETMSPLVMTTMSADLRSGPIFFGVLIPERLSMTQTPVISSR